MGKAIDVYHQTYNKLLLIGDFNAEDPVPYLSQFLFKYHAKNLSLNKRALNVYKGNRSRIDLVITNSPDSIQNTSTIVTGLSVFYKKVITILKATFTKSQKLIPIEILNCLMKKKLNLI